MKKVTCSALGGPCNEAIPAETKEELMTKGMDHVKAAHPEMVHDIETMSPEANAEWMKTFDAAWDAAPDMTPEEIETEKEVLMM